MPLISNPEDIALNDNDDVQQILGRTPNWMLRWGSTLIAFGFAFIVFVAWYVRYPDIVPAQVTLTTEQPPIPVVARTNGKISTLNVIEKQAVAEGQVLAVLENPAETVDILQLEAFLKKIEQLESPLDIVELDKLPPLKLGNLQNSYATMTLQVSNLIYFFDEEQVAQSIKALKRQIRKIKKLNDALSQQKETLAQVNELNKLRLERNENLIKDEGLVSMEEVERAKVGLLQSKRQLELLDTDVINNELRIQQIKEKILNLAQGNKNNYSDKWLKLLENIQKLNGEIALWKEQYLLIAPIDGQVTLPNIQHENQFVKNLEEVMYVTPTNNSGDIYGQANLPLPKAGKVEVGQDVKIRLLDYPYQEYGVVQGRVKDLALLPTTDENGNTSYYVEINLPEGLLTTYGDSTLHFRQEMQGIAQIITAEQSILGNLFNKILSQIWN